MKFWRIIPIFNFLIIFRGCELFIPRIGPMEGIVTLALAALFTGLILGVEHILDNITTTFDGILYIDRHDEDKDRYKFMVDDLEKMAQKKKLTIKVDSTAILDD